MWAWIASLGALVGIGSVIWLYVRLIKQSQDSDDRRYSNPTGGGHEG